MAEVVGDGEESMADRGDGFEVAVVIEAIENQFPAFLWQFFRFLGHLIATLRLEKRRREVFI